MVVAYFKKFGEVSYAHDFTEFLKYYGHEFNPTLIGIALIKNNEYYFYLQYIFIHNKIRPFFELQKEGLPNNTFTLLDTVNIGRNIGSGSYNIKLILNEFKESMNKLDTFKQKLEDISKNLKYKDTNIDDLDNIEDPEFKALVKMNLMECLLS